MNTPVEIAKHWLNREYETIHGPPQGPAGTWPPDAKERFYRDLGLLVDFMTDEWPRDKCAWVEQDTKKKA